MALYVNSVRWSRKAKGLRSHALVLAKALDLHTQNPPRDAEAWDVIASRLEAIMMNA